MENKITNELVELCEFFGSKYLQDRADAALEANKIIETQGLTWSQVFGKIPDPYSDQPHIARTRKYNGFIPFSEIAESTYDEARGYSILMATKDEKPQLIRIMQRDRPLRDLTEDQQQLIGKLRDDARELRNLLVAEVFVLKNGRRCRVISDKA